MKLPPPLEAVVESLQKLPGVGAKSAQRMALHLLKEGPEAMAHLAHQLQQAADKVGFCQVCGAFTDQPTCPICLDPRRDPSSLVIVAEASNVLSFERSGHFRGRYHVLGGLISPLRGVGPDQLRVRELLKRLEDGAIQEIILATNPTVDGEATASWLARILEPIGVRTTRIGLGLPIGSDLEYADELTLDRAMEGRRPVG
ncbi:MAG TPA: recombination mediator RecR [Geothrix sp.]|uniref:recombination mediator RecR n=1 Tax=Geothrix TaxID=44675 RepID=UPI001FAC97C2|nr:recombination mediator RecR [Geothrix sp.]HJW44031.1 recombination mediator RecR [Geothrix sp.]